MHEIIVRIGYCFLSGIGKHNTPLRIFKRNLSKYITILYCYDFHLNSIPESLFLYICVFTKKHNHICKYQRLSVSFHIDISNALLCFQIYLNKQGTSLGKAENTRNRTVFYLLQ